VEKAVLYVLFGEDTFSSKEALDELVAGGAGDAASVVHLDGSRLEVAQLSLVGDTMPLWDERRLVVVEGLLARFEVNARGKSRQGGVETVKRRADAEQRELRAKAFAEYFERLPSTTDLLLLDGALESQSKKQEKSNLLLPMLREKATVRHFPPLSGRSLDAWLGQRASTLGCTMTPGATKALTGLLGGNLWALVQELPKLAAYAKGRTVTEEDVHLLVSDAREANIFSMLDAMVQGKEAVALRLLQQLIDQGAAAPYLLFMITRQFRQLLRVKGLTASGTTDTEMARRVSFPTSYAAQRVMELGRRYSMSQIEAIYRRLLQTDLSIKRGRVDEGTALTLLVMDFSQGARA